MNTRQGRAPLVSAARIWQLDGACWFPAQHKRRTSLIPSPSNGCVSLVSPPNTYAFLNVLALSWYPLPSSKYIDLKTFSLVPLLTTSIILASRLSVPLFRGIPPYHSVWLAGIACELMTYLAVHSKCKGDDQLLAHP